MTLEKIAKYVFIAFAVIAIVMGLVVGYMACMHACDRLTEWGKQNDRYTKAINRLKELKDKE